MVLTQDEIDGCRDAFLAFDKGRSGTIDVWELRQVLEAMGQKPAEEELFQMISEVNHNGCCTTNTLALNRSGPSAPRCFPQRSL